MAKILFALASLLITVSVQADSCALFVGKFGATNCVSGWPNKMYPDFVYSGLDISEEKNTEALEMTYHLGQNQFTAIYIADGLEHPGDDVNTGETYTASCNQNQLITRQVFSQLKHPLVTTLTIQENSIDFVESFEGNDFTRVCTLVPAR